MPPSTLAAPETQIQLTPNGEIQLQRFSFREAEQNSYDSPPAQNPDKFMLLENVLSGLTGNLQRRWGYKLWESGGFAPRHLYEYQRDSDGARQIIVAAGDGSGASNAANAVFSFNEDGSGVAGLFTPAAGAGNPRAVISRSYAYFVDGVAGDQKKWPGPGGGLFKWGITPPVTAISVGAPTAGAITLTSGRNYFVVFKNSTTLHHSDLNPVSASTGPISGKNIPLTNIEVSGDAQVDRKIVLATADGGNQETLYFVADLANATTTLTDSVPESTLLTQNIFLETDAEGIQHGVADNAVPPNATLPVKHRGRLYMAQGQFLRFSKNLDEVTTSTGATAGAYEEAWPADYQLDISEGAETARALMSDGNVLYIGTERHIRRLLGDGPTNFQTPEVVFNEAGVLSPETWKVVFLEGQPLGTMWLTPDFRVIGSDFNVYKDVGTPIQDVLNTINTAASSKACATYYAIGSYNYFLLAIPTGANTENDTLCIYDLKFRKWYVWRLTDQVISMLNNIQASGTPQLIFYTVAHRGYTFGTALTQDRVNNTPVNFTCKAQTSWLDIGGPGVYKALNLLRVLSNDSSLVFDVEGAVTDADFTSPISIVSGQALRTGPTMFSEKFFPFFTTKTRYKFYRFTFRSAGTSLLFLDGYDLRAFPIR